MDKFFELLEQRVGGYAPLNKLIFSCYQLALELKLDIVSFKIYDRDGCKYLQVEYVNENDEVEYGVHCFG